MLVVTAIAAPLHGPELGEFLLPVAQHMRLDAAQFTDFTNGEVAFGRNQGERILHANQQSELQNVERTPSTTRL